MNKPEATNFITLENVAFLIDGFGSITYRLGIFFVILVILTLASDLITGLSDFGIRSTIFIVCIYLVIAFVSIAVVAFLRLKAVHALKNKDKEKYFRFLQSDKNTKHEILGKLI